MRKPYTTTPPVVMTIAGVDSGGGAGVAADLKTFAALGVHGTCAVTALTAQNTQGVTAIVPTSPEMVVAQIEANVSDFGCDALKTGMLATAEIVEAVYACVARLHLKNLVVDPVMIATSGALLLAPEAREAYREMLIPVSTVITPNVPEAESLLGHSLHGVDDLPAAARELSHQWEPGPEAVIITGGHCVEKGEATDVLYERKTNRVHYLLGPALETGTTHGSGCVFAAALAAHLSAGAPLLKAAQAAKQFTTEALRYGLHLGAGVGPVNPMWNLVQKEETR
ncbi:MAG TPA: bifunctional hydroxymethylpyrimidine kinase/phosphomethylpyrimidine kinase [Armatimonadota bacterium]|jgi:hydroxymethylpyrimidine/phosphomethylpyrimidine kinase